MKGKKLWAVALAVVSLIYNVVPVNATEDNSGKTNSLQEVVSNLENGYSEYYDILNSELTLYSSQNVDGNIENIYCLDLTAVLKADDVEQMDYYQGITDYYDTSTVELSQFNSKNDLLRLNMIAEEKSNIYEKLKAHIGEKQNLLFLIKEIYSANNETGKEILIENGIDYVLWEEMLPASHEELREKGYASMAYFDSEYATMAGDVTLQQTRASFIIENGIDYMLRYTSNPSSCNACGKACDNFVDTTKYNPNYKHYAADHSDCANYISQAIHAAGIATDSTWKPESLAWINVSKLTDYMTSTNHWKSITYDKVQEGDIVSFKSQSHVVMITWFDGTTYKYSGHTNDRKNYTISIKGSDNYYRLQ